MKYLYWRKESRWQRLQTGSDAEDSVLRVWGSVSRMAIPEELKHPAVLPKTSRVSQLLLSHIHMVGDHSGRNHVSKASAGVLDNASKFRHKENSQLLCSVDVLTPLWKNTRWLTYQATAPRNGLGHWLLHINSAVLHLQKRSKRWYNGTNFIGSERDLRESLSNMDHSKIQHVLLSEEVKWTLNPPTGPHQGGVWERLILSINKVLYSVLREQTQDDEGLQTALCETEAILKDRPFTTVSDDPMISRVWPRTTVCS